MKVVILGCHESGKKYHNSRTDEEVWTMNWGIEIYANKKIDLIFDLHDWINSLYIPKYYEKIQESKVPIVKLKNDNKIKNQIIFDEKEVYTILGFRPCTTVSYMIAYAIKKKVKEIDFIGITNEFFELRPQQGFSVARSIGVAENSGIKCNLKNLYFGEDVEKERDIHWFGIWR